MYPTFTRAQFLAVKFALFWFCLSQSHHRKTGLQNWVWPELIAVWLDQPCCLVRIVSSLFQCKLQRVTRKKYPVHFVYSIQGTAEEKDLGVWISSDHRISLRLKFTSNVARQTSYWGCMLLWLPCLFVYYSIFCLFCYISLRRSQIK